MLEEGQKGRAQQVAQRAMSSKLLEVPEICRFWAYCCLLSHTLYIGENRLRVKTQRPKVQRPESQDTQRFQCLPLPGLSGQWFLGPMAASPISFVKWGVTG